jgi:DNA transformation protein
MTAVPHDDFIAYLHELLEPVGKVSARAMFGGWGVYVDGIIIGIVVEGRLYLKADALSEPQFIATGNAPFMYPSPKGPMAMSYWSIPEDALDSSEAMRPWAKLALEAARRKAAATKPKSSAKGKDAKPKPTSLTNRKQATDQPQPSAKRMRKKKAP